MAWCGELCCSASLEQFFCGFQGKVFAQKGSTDTLMFLLYTDTCSLYIQGQRCQYSSRAESSLLLWVQKDADICPETGRHCTLLSWEDLHALTPCAARRMLYHLVLVGGD